MTFNTWTITEKKTEKNKSNLKAVYPPAKPNNNQNQEILSPYGIEWNPDFLTLQLKGNKNLVQKFRYI